MSAVTDDPFVPQPDDGENVTRGEHRRLTHIVIGRLERIEGLCFEDAPNRPSLESLMRKIDEHINVVCAWARWFKWTVVGLGTLAAAVLSVLKLLKDFPALWPW